VRIADFSLGRRVRELIAAANGVRLEDPYPPSIGRGGKKSDIFRLGLVLVSLVTGRRVEDQLPVLRKEGKCTDDLFSRKPGFLLSTMHSRAFRWFSAAPLVFLFLGFLPL
jgi:hypothetical protein